MGQKAKKILKITLFSIGGLILVVYFGGVIYFSKHFDYGTTINGRDVYGDSVDEVEEYFDELAENYKLEIEAKDKDYFLGNTDGGLKVTVNEDVSSFKDDESAWLWFVYLPKKEDYTVTYNADYDREEVIEYLDSLEFMDEGRMVPSTDAKVRMVDGEVVIEEDVTGTVVDRDVLYDVICKALDEHSMSVNLADADCYVRADITADCDFIAECKKNAEDFLDIEACYKLNNYIIQIPREELSKMAYVGDDGKVKLVKDNVRTYCMNFADTYSTVGKERDFVTHDRKNIKVKSDKYGWSINGEKETEELFEALCEKKNFIKEPVCDQKGYTYTEKGDIGNSYVEVDLSKQRVYLYKNGRKILETDCVSGCWSAGHTTPGGLYGLYYKKTNVTLVGPGYESPVAYWMPFNGGIGLHDASWRGEFGDDIYVYEGSHGCVNLPRSAAAELYEELEPNYPIVCYWSEKPGPSDEDD